MDGDAMSEKPKKTLDLVAELHARIDLLDERIAALEDQSRTSVTAKSVKKPESK